MLLVVSNVYGAFAVALCILELEVKSLYASWFNVARQFHHLCSIKAAIVIKVLQEYCHYAPLISLAAIVPDTNLGTYPVLVWHATDQA